MKFRIWSVGSRRFDTDVFLFQNGRLGRCQHEIHPDQWSLKNEDYLVQRCVGTKDKNKKDVFVGDIVKFKFWVGDFAWEYMSEEETKANEEMLGGEYVGEVYFDSFCLAYKLKTSEIGGTPFITFPGVYISMGTVIGNVMENKELLQ